MDDDPMDELERIAQANDPPARETARGPKKGRGLANYHKASTDLRSKLRRAQANHLTRKAKQKEQP